MKVKDRINTLRTLMNKEKINTCIITKNDPHQSEYSPDFWNEVKYISGFSGSNGVVVITSEKAGLWTDGRYSIQAEKELEGSGIEVYITTNTGTIDYLTFAKDETPENGVIAFDGRTISVIEARNLNKKVQYKNINLKTDIDLVGEIWKDRPSLSQYKVFEHDIKYCGKSRNEKVNELRQKMKQEDSNVYVISSADDIAWLFNLRGKDMEGVPFFASYAVIDETNATIFIHGEKGTDVKTILENDNIILKDYYEIYDYLKNLKNISTILINPFKTSYSLYKVIEQHPIKNIAIDITSNFKAIKNETELKNIENTNIRDGIAMLRFSMWLQENVKKSDISEFDIALKIEEFRKSCENYFDQSFSTIAAYMSNAAMMHYRAKEDSCSKLKPEGMLLVDSGGNYLDGTTDITRTYILGEISEKMKRDFTLVLKSHISLAKAIFLYGTTGSNLDVLARLPMWSNCMDYKSGTGHGIGFFLSVHEGPHRISQIPNNTPLEIGMIMSNEPGVYRQNEYGIRTENTMKVVEHSESEFGKFLKFEVISYFPIDLKGIDINMLNDEEKDWLNNYHKTVFDKLSPYLNDLEAEWLKNETKPI